ncbi:hypothetical protein AAH979_09930 [Plantactinospora sp. ZYX-F-223]|uniref:hypothetical protein n=1 Tax=Plantactinospora sp. ZYX-F-223 TaxID=3144103 RepID=UPI0031FDF87B
MTTLAQLRKTALSLLEAVERSGRAGRVEFTVRDKWFASAGGDGDVWLHLPNTEVDAVLAAHPNAQRLTRGAERHRTAGHPGATQRRHHHPRPGPPG